MRYSVRLRGFRLPPRPTDLSLPGEAAPLNRKGAGRGGAPALPPRWIAPSACRRAEKDKGFSQSATRPLPRSGTGTAPVAAVTGGARGDSKEIMEDTQILNWEVEEEEEVEERPSESLGYSLEPLGQLRIFSSSYGPEKGQE